MSLLFFHRFRSWGQWSWRRLQIALREACISASSLIRMELTSCLGPIFFLTLNPVLICCLNFPLHDILLYSIYCQGWCKYNTHPAEIHLETAPLGTESGARHTYSACGHLSLASFCFLEDHSLCPGKHSTYVELG